MDVGLYRLMRFSFSFFFLSSLCCVCEPLLPHSCRVYRSARLAVDVIFDKRRRRRVLTASLHTRRQLAAHVMLPQERAHLLRVKHFGPERELTEKEKTSREVEEIDTRRQGERERIGIVIVFGGRPPIKKHKRSSFYFPFEKKGGGRGGLGDGVGGNSSPNRF